MCVPCNHSTWEGETEKGFSLQWPDETHYDDGRRSGTCLVPSVHIQRL